MPSKIRGRDRLRYVLKQLPKEERRQIKAAILIGAREIQQTQRRLAPFKTGKLRRSIVVTPGDRDVPRYATLKSNRTILDPELAAIISAGNRGVRYAHLVEFGAAPHTNQGRFPGTMNPGVPPRPYFYPGFRANKKRVQNTINKAARKAIRDSIQ